MITLTYNASVITIRSPSLGNKDIARKERIKKETIGGERIIFAASEWPQSREIQFEFNTLSQVEAIALVNFIKFTLGKVVMLLDFEGRTHSGVIITPDIEVSQDRNCSYNTSFNFLVIP